jgi:hypothetical protein
MPSPRYNWTNGELETLTQVHGSKTLEELRDVYFPEKTVASIRYQVNRLRLGKADIWQDWEVNAVALLKKRNVPNRVIAEIVHRTPQAVAQKAHKLGFNVQGRDLVDDSHEVDHHDKMLDLDNKAVGTITENCAFIKLTLEGFDVVLPYMNNHKTDAMVVADRSVVKLQMKTAVYEKTTKRYRCELGTKHVRKGTRNQYKQADVDFFVVKCGGLDEWYVFPYEVSKRFRTPNMYPHRLKQVHRGYDFEIYRNRWDLIREHLAKQCLSHASNGDLD